MQIDNSLEHNRPDVTVIDKKKKKCLLIDPTCPFDIRTEKIEEEKYTNFSELKYEIAKIWKMRNVEVIPVVIGALGTVTKHLEKWIEKLDLNLSIEALQKPCLLGPMRIIRKVLDEILEKKATIPKTTGWCPLLWHPLPGNNIRPESKRNNNNNNNNNNNDNNNSSNNNNNNNKNAYISILPVSPRGSRRAHISPNED